MVKYKHQDSNILVALPKEGSYEIRVFVNVVGFWGGCSK